MKIIVILALSLSLPLSAQAEVFKCKTGESKTVYQPTPCPNAAETHKVEVPTRSAEQEAKAEAQLKAWNDNYAAREMAEYQAQQAEFERRLRLKEVEAQQQNADAQYKQKDALDRQAAALDKRNRMIEPPPVMPGVPGYWER